MVAGNESAREDEGGRRGGAGPHRELVREEHRGGRVVEGAVPGGPRGVRVAGVGGVQDDGHRVRGGHEGFSERLLACLVRYTGRAHEARGEGGDPVGRVHGGVRAVEGHKIVNRFCPEKREVSIFDGPVEI